MSALARSEASEFVFWLAAIQTGAPVGSKRLRSCSRTSASVRTVTRVLGPALAADLAGARMPNITRPTPMAAPAAMRMTAADIAQPPVKCQRLSTSLGPPPAPDVMLGHDGSGWLGLRA